MYKNMLALLSVLVANAMPQGKMYVSGGGSELSYNAINGWGTVGKMKTFAYCTGPEKDLCSTPKWVGLFGSDLVAEVSQSNDALVEAKKFQKIAVTKGLLMFSIPIFLFSGIGLANSEIIRNPDGTIKDQNMPGSAIFLLTMTGASFLGFIITSVMEKSQLHKVAEAYNKNLKLSLNSGVDPKERKINISYDF